MKIQKDEESQEYDECPYCHEEFTQGDYNGDPLSEGEEVEIECPKCDKEIIISATYSVDYYVYKPKEVQL